MGSFMRVSIMSRGTSFSGGELKNSTLDRTQLTFFGLALHREPKPLGRPFIKNFLGTHTEIFIKSFLIKLKSDCIYHCV